MTFPFRLTDDEARAAGSGFVVLVTSDRQAAALAARDHGAHLTAVPLMRLAIASGAAWDHAGVAVFAGGGRYAVLTCPDPSRRAAGPGCADPS